MSQKKFDLMYIGGRYMKSGEEKVVWKTAGALFQGDNGKDFILLDRAFNPAGVPMQKLDDENVMISLVEPKTRKY